MSGTLLAAYAPAYALIAPLAGITTIWANQNAPRPAKPYVSLRIASRKTDEHDEYGPVTADGTQVVVANSEITLEVQAYGDGAQAALEAVRAKLGLQTVVQSTAALGIAVRSRGQVMNVTQLLDASSFEDRAVLEVVIGYRENVTDTVGLIQSITGTGVYGVGIWGEAVPFASDTSKSTIPADDGTDLSPDFEPTGVGS